ncbi:uncharacterized protein LOC135943068 [Cloeon dipterum]|uniref:uncharacterized protein LOC135943068 n=1 Tax=Cloeon dipterum TaxID=197152 RepID=UPI00322080A0
MTSSADEETVGLGQGEREHKEVTPQETAEESGSQQSSQLVKTSAEKNPIPGPSSEGRKGRNLKRSNDRAEDTHGAKQKKKSTSTVSDSDESKKEDKSDAQFRIEGTPSGAIDPCPQHKGSSRSWKQLIQSQEASGTERIVGEEDPKPGPSSQVNKNRNLKRINDNGNEGNEHGANPKRDNNPQQFPNQNYQLQSDDQIGGNYQRWEYDETMNQQGQVEEWQPRQTLGDGYQHYHDAHQVPNMPYDNYVQSYYQDFTEQTNDFAGLFPAGTEQSSNSQPNAQNYQETPENEGVGSLYVQQSQFLPDSSQFANPQPFLYYVPAQQPYQIFQNVLEMDANHVSNVVPEEREQNEVPLQEPVQESESQQISEPGMTDAEKNPLPGPSSETNNVRNLKRKNDRAKETHGANPKKKSTLPDTDS